MLTQEYLKSVVSYDTNTGIFTNLKKRGNRALVGSICGHASKHGYIIIHIDYTKYYAHRLAWLYVYGYFPAIIDHINGNGMDNRISNLRECTHAQNIANSRKRKSNNSGYRGITFCKTTNKYRATIYAKGKRTCLGRYQTAIEASKAYIEASAKIHGEYSVYFESS